jgi:hypothetical protein
MKKEIIHQYFKKKLEDYIVLVQVNPEAFSGLELIVHPDGKVEKTKMKFDEDIIEDLTHDEFVACSALEFHLYLKGLVK